MVNLLCTVSYVHCELAIATCTIVHQVLLASFPGPGDEAISLSYIHVLWRLALCCTVDFPLHTYTLWTRLSGGSHATFMTYLIQSWMWHRPASYPGPVQLFVAWWTGPGNEASADVTWWLCHSTRVVYCLFFLHPWTPLTDAALKVDLLVFCDPWSC